jgi:hypothetical protein
MANLSKKNFLKNFSSRPELHKKTLKAGGVQWSDLKQHPNDYYTANTGAVTGMIYYSDTVKFAKKNHLQILQALADFESECGTLENKPNPTDETQYFNWLSWFIWENMMSEIISYLEQ